MNAKITAIDLNPDYNYVSFNDSDPVSDYFHGYCLPVKQTIDWVKKDGASKIVVSLVNNQERTAYFQRVKNIAKACGYVFERKEVNRRGSDGYKWKEVSYILYKKSVSENSGGDCSG